MILYLTLVTEMLLHFVRDWTVWSASNQQNKQLMHEDERADRHAGFMCWAVLGCTIHYTPHSTLLMVC